MNITKISYYEQNAVNSIAKQFMKCATSWRILTVSSYREAPLQVLPLFAVETRARSGDTSLVIIRTFLWYGFAQYSFTESINHQYSFIPCDIRETNDSFL